MKKKKIRRRSHINGNPLHGGDLVDVGSADPETGAPGGTVPAQIQDLKTLKGQWFRHTRTDCYVVVVDVGPKGVLAKDCEGPFQPGYGETYGITWLALRALYNIQVSAREVAGAKA